MRKQGFIVLITLFSITMTGQTEMLIGQISGRFVVRENFDKEGAFLNKQTFEAEETINNLKNWISNNGIICEDKTDNGWGLYGKPHSLNYASSTQSILYCLFDKETIESDLKELINRQKEDGRWDTWYGISEGTKLEWAGIQTLWALKTLKNYDSIEN